MKINEAINNLKHGKCIPYKHETLTMAIEALEQKEKSEYEHDHAVVKAYTDGQTYILDKIRTEIMSLTNGDTPERIWNVDVIKIIDKYGGE